MIIVSIWRFIVTSNDPMAIDRPYIYIEPLKSYYRVKTHSKVLHDWNDYRLMKTDELRSGYGEHGSRYKFRQ